MSKKKIFFLFIIPIVLSIIASFITFKVKSSNQQVKAANILVPFLTPTFTPTPTITPSPTLTPTPTMTLTPTLVPTPIIPSPYLNDLFTKYCNEYGVDDIGRQLLIKIANCESHFNTGVVSANGKYAGMFQFNETTWTTIRNTMGQNPDLNLRFSADESIKTAAYVAHLGRFNIWPVCRK